ncbi:hypothetical protein WJX84_010996 [Apatococcus fuscideae]|uniref:Sterol 3-beta-glucosyltransferase n=1 Tax=Apatococcus fuscideae TaxID=2026836 RepID=A0AAW1TA90_9CHLO
MSQGFWGPGGDVITEDPRRLETVHHSLDLHEGLPDVNSHALVHDIPDAAHSPHDEDDNDDEESADRHKMRGPFHLTYTFRHKKEGEPIEQLEALSLKPDAAEAETPPSHDPSGVQPIAASGDSFAQQVPPLAIVMLVVGTRGDVQPFIALGMELKKWGHRVRLATHAVYRSFVEGFDLEFYPLGGDPTVLSEYVVRNRGVMPHGVREIGDQRKQLRDIIFSCWPACSAPDPDHTDMPFMAEAVIANPVSYAHFHCADKLKIPLHLFFPMPWTPTKAFPHPMARILYRGFFADHVGQAKRASYFQSVEDARIMAEQMGDPGLRERMGRRMHGVHRMGQGFVVHQMGVANKLSYMALDDLMFPGVADILEEFRENVLKLDGLHGQLHTVHQTACSRVPFTYCWSTAVVPKPEDWGYNIDVCGYFLLDLAQASKFEPPQDLIDFLKKGSPPIYFGFGSMIMDSPHKLSRVIFEALEAVGKRAIIQRGWGKLGEIPGVPVPENVYLIDQAPHDWLFPKCSGVVHHGGAGTVAAGLIANCPTLVVPFFGDQPFWGEAVQAGKLGPKAIPIDSFSRKRLIAALHTMDDPEVRKAVTAVGQQIRSENGAAAGADSFHRHLPLDYMVGKAEGEDRLHQPGAPMDHCPESSAVPLQPLRRRIHPKRFSRASKEVLQSPSATSSEPADIAPQGSGEAAGQGPRSSAEAPREERRTILTHLSKSGGEQPGSRGRVGQWLHEHLSTGPSQFLFSPAMDGVVSAQEGGQGAMPSADQEGVPAARLAAAEQSSEQHCGEKPDEKASVEYQRRSDIPG